MNRRSWVRIPPLPLGTSVAAVAQDLVERRIEDPLVVGSNPTRGILVIYEDRDFGHEVMYFATSWNYHKSK